MIERIASGRTDLVFDHLEAGGEPGAVDGSGVSLSSWCAYYGDVSALRALLRHGARLEDLGDDYDLNGASFHGHWQLTEFLVERGADPDRADPDTGETPLHAGADVEARDANGDTPLSWASWHLRPDAVLRLLLHGDHSLHPDRNSAYDHGQGWGALDDHLLGGPGGR